MPLALLFLAVSNTFAQQVDHPQNPITCSSACTDSKFRYIFCRQTSAGTVEYVTICSSNPNNETDPSSGQAMKVYRPTIKNGLFCWSYNRRSFDQAQAPIAYTIRTGDVTKTVYSFIEQNHIQACIDAAIRDWTSACSSGGEPLNFVSSSWPTDCCVAIKFSTDNRDFFAEPDNDEPPYAIYRRRGSSATSCNGIYCFDANQANPTPNETARILINMSSQLTQGNADGYPRRFYATELGSLGAETIANLRAQGRQYVDLCSVIRHEIGHVFGFADDQDQSPNVSYGEDCKDDAGIMAWGPRFDEDSWVSKGISESDRCRFMKLYCCTETVLSVLEKAEATFKGFIEDEEVAVLVYDLNGALLSVFDSKFSQSPSSLMRGVKFESGVYLVVLNNKKHTTTFKLVAAN